MKITIISNEPPVPCNTGGRNDVWRRLSAFAQQGVQIQLICWHSDRHSELSKDDLQRLSTVTNSFHLLRIGLDIWSLFKRGFFFLKYPSHVAARIVSRKEQISILRTVKEFEPDCIWLDGIDGGVLASCLSNECNVPLFVRSHNIEYQYRRKLAAAATDMSARLRFWLNSVHLEKYEKRTLKSCKLFFDISVDDLAYWKSTGLSNGRLLPPLVDETFLTPLKKQETNFDIAYLGALCMPNNIEGVDWFVSGVLPKIISILPGVRVAVGGSSPTKQVEEICSRSANITLVPNPENILDFYHSASVLINPVRCGSGVNVKSVEMLFTGKHVVTTVAGIKGLPDEAKRCFLVADTEGQMADAILGILSGRVQPVQDRSKVFRYFLPDVIKDVLVEMGYAKDTTQ